MNNNRRKELQRARTMVEEAKAIIETCASEERGFYDDMPLAIQEGTRGERAEAVADGLDEAADSLDNVVANLEEACE